MGRVARKRKHHGNGEHAQYRTRRYKRDLDLIHQDLRPDQKDKLITQPIDEYKPGLGQFYCIECARYMENQFALDSHKRSKLHKKRLKVLKEPPFTQKEADIAVNLFTESDLKPAVAMAID